MPLDVSSIGAARKLSPCYCEPLLMDEREAATKLAEIAALPTGDERSYHVLTMGIFLDALHRPTDGL